MEVNEYYKTHGWKILRFWEHQIKHNLDAAVATVETYLTLCSSAHTAPPLAINIHYGYYRSGFRLSIIGS
jgi:hypothetical protein